MPQTTSRFQELIDSIETMADEDQAMLVNIIQKRLQEKRRQALIEEIRDAEDEYRHGRTSTGSVADFMKDVESCED